MRKFLVSAVLCISAFPLASLAQDEMQTVACTFNDGRSMTVNYKAPVKGEKLPNNSVYSPGGTPMSLLTEAPLRFGNAVLQTGGYHLFVIPSQKSKWILVVSKGLKDGAYDQTQDIARVPMDSGTIPSESPFSISLTHGGPKMCSVTIYSGKTGSFADFMEE